MHINKQKEENSKYSKKGESEIDRYLFGDDNELDQNELVQGFDADLNNSKK